MVNEREVAEHLERKGFSIVDPSTMTVQNQASLFYNAKLIIGDEGAALVNCMYCGPETTIACIMPQVWHDKQFTTIGYMARAKVINLDACKVGKDRFHLLDLDYLDRFLEKFRVQTK